MEGGGVAQTRKCQIQYGARTLIDMFNSCGSIGLRIVNCPNSSRQRTHHRRYPHYHSHHHHHPHNHLHHQPQHPYSLVGMVSIIIAVVDTI